MIITPKQVKNLSYVIVDDLYSVEELAEIKNELRELMPFVKPPEKTGSAFEGVESNFLNKAKGLFLDQHFAEDRSKSSILRLNRNIFNEAILEEAVKLNSFFYSLRECTYDCSLVNYYGSEDEYKPHRDANTLTVVTFFSFGNVVGGDLEFPEQNEIVAFRENRSVFFPGCTLHAAKKPLVEEGNFRVSLAQFLSYR